MGRINRFKRVQKRLRIKDVYPILHNNRCDCGCGRKLRGRARRWATKACSKRAGLRLQIIKGNVTVIRRELFKRDKGQCKHCRKRFKWSGWEADHRVPVAAGGGGCDLDGFDTLCIECHQKKTKKDMVLIRKIRATRRKKKIS